MQELGPVAAELQMEIRQRLEPAEHAEYKPVRQQTCWMIPTTAPFGKCLVMTPNQWTSSLNKPVSVPAKISSMLLMMELKGMVKNRPMAYT